MARRDAEFQTIRSEGGLLPSDLLRRLLDPKSGLEGAKPEDYGLAPGERLNEAITQSWNRLQKHWADFLLAATNLPAGDAGTGLTNDKWTLPLLRELGFGFLTTTAGPEVGGRTYPISRFHGPVPIHLVGCGVPLDRRSTGVAGAARVNPHGLVQEFLNRSPDHLWAIVSNGLRLRVLRDNQALSRQSFLEFDLESMFVGEVYSDFVVLWLVSHATRFNPQEGGRGDSCWLERWAKQAAEQGTRALNELRGGVERALQILGEGFTAHPNNATLRDRLRTGDLSLVDLHAQLLRVVYRFIFLFVAEDRAIEGQALLHPRDSSEAARAARAHYRAHYGTGRLRELASRIKGSRHGDLWRQFQILVGGLSGDDAGAAIRKELALPALGSFLWNPMSTSGLTDAELTNYDFLEALRHLAFTRNGKDLRSVDYKNMGAEEIGGVYESLLGLTPQISADGARFTFAEFAGNERKTSGAYYTPDVLVQCLLDSALDPVVEEATKDKTGADAVKAILALKVCDPAVGSGHFLVGAAHRMARHLARVRSQMQGESEPSPLSYQHALRDVIGRCLYGVDINPMAAELCRVSLWLEALEPGKPLSFLDHHIRVGNSLLGATPELIAAGVPDDAFKLIEGDDRDACAELKKRNKAERRAIGGLFAEEDAQIQARLAEAAAALDELPDDRPEELLAKELTFRRYEQTEEYQDKKRLADFWCSAFVIKKQFVTDERQTRAHGITQGLLDDLSSGKVPADHILAQVKELARRYQFFHWHLSFPEVFACGGFDCISGNPPWELMEVEDGATAGDDFARLQLWFRSNRYALLNGRRDLYKLFLVKCSVLLNPHGRLGFLTPLGVFIEDEASEWRRTLFDDGSVLLLRHFQNHRKSFFPGVHASYRFCGIVYSADRTAPHQFSTVALSPIELPLQYFIRVERSEFDTWLGTDRAATIYQEARSAIVHRTILRKLGTIQSSGFRVVAEFHASSDKALIKSTPLQHDWALPKNRNIHQLDHNFAPYEAWVEQGDVAERLVRKRLSSASWVSAFPRLLFRDIARNDDERTLIACLAPPGVVSTYDTPMFVPDCEDSDYPTWICFYGAAFATFVIDFLIRPVVDKHIKGYTLARLRWPAPSELPNGWQLDWFVLRLLELTFTIGAFEAFARDCGWTGGPFRQDEQRRFVIRCEMDAAFFHLYLPAGTDGNWLPANSEQADELELVKESFPGPRDAVSYIMDTFPIVRRKDEEKYGDYLTKRVILEIYDAMQEAMVKGEPYQSRLEPPPADPRLAHGLARGL